LELVYLWVEEYKNIHKQGFNFSSRFECKFHDEYDEDGNLKDDCKLEIKPKDHIKNFFGENINVTAIVGKNGSGKSSVFEILSHILIKKDKLKYFFVLFDGIHNTVYSNDIFVSTTLKNEYYVPTKYLDTGIVHSKNNSDIALASFIQMYYLNISHLERDSIIKNDEMESTDPIKYLGIYAKNNSELTNEKCVQPSFSSFNLSKFNFLEIYNIVHLLKDEKYKDHLFKLFDIKEPKYIKLYPDTSELDRMKVTNSIKREGYLVSDRVPPLIDKIFQFLSTLDEDKKIEINSSDYNKLFEFQNFSDVIKLEFLSDDCKTIRFSAGEKTVFFYIVRIYKMLQEIKATEKITILLWDEIELYLHPLWQKRILNIIINFIYIEKLETLLHIIVTSHSPFLLSDIPKQNIIFLDTYKEEDNEVKIGNQKVGNCKVVDGLKDKKQTFGANIHTLLSDSFFMEDGLMGEFAKGKINEIIDFHKEVEKEDKKEKSNFAILKVEYEKVKIKFWDIQSIIGEEYLKQVIKNHLRDIESLLGYKEARKEEIKRLRAEADRLEKM